MGCALAELMEEIDTRLAAKSAAASNAAGAALGAPGSTEPGTAASLVTGVEKSRAPAAAAGGGALACRGSAGVGFAAALVGLLKGSLPLLFLLIKLMCTAPSFGAGPVCAWLVLGLA